MGMKTLFEIELLEVRNRMNSARDRRTRQLSNKFWIICQDLVKKHPRLNVSFNLDHSYMQALLRMANRLDRIGASGC